MKNTSRARIDEKLSISDSTFQEPLYGFSVVFRRTRFILFIFSIFLFFLYINYNIKYKISLSEEFVIENIDFLNNGDNWPYYFTIILAVFWSMFAFSLQGIFRSGDTFKATRDLESFTGISVFGEIPLAPFSRRGRLANYLSTRPISTFSEAVRNLRTSIMFSEVDNSPRVILMASSIPGEGKTSQSVALAHSYAIMGNKVLLIEGDLRRRSFKEYFDLKHDRGLISLLSASDSLQDIIHSDEQLRIDILLAEATNLNPLDIFSSIQFKELIRDLGKAYDVIVIDSPPVLYVADARVLGSLVDCVVFCVRWNRTTRAQVAQSLRAFSSVNVQVSGLTLSQVNYQKARMYGEVTGDLQDKHVGNYYTD